MKLQLEQFFGFCLILSQCINCRVDTSRWVGLTHPLSPENPVYTPGYSPLKINEEKSKAQSNWPGAPYDGVWAAFRFLEMYEHTGTHVDAPLHFAENGKTEDQLTWDELTGPLVIVDVTHKVNGKEQITVTADDFEMFVSKNGPIEPNSFLFIYSGWSQYFFTDHETYKSKAVCLNESAINWIIENVPDLKGFGLEALTPECNKEGKWFTLHRTILPRNQIIIENVGPGMDKLPPKGADLMIFPMHLKDGTGSPARLVAFVNDSSTIRSNLARSLMGVLMIVSVSFILL